MNPESRPDSEVLSEEFSEENLELAGNSTGTDVLEQARLRVEQSSDALLRASRIPEDVSEQLEESIHIALETIAPSLSEEQADSIVAGAREEIGRRLYAIQHREAQEAQSELSLQRRQLGD